MRLVPVLALALSIPSAHAEPSASASTHGQLVELSWADSPSDRTRIAVALPPEKGCSTIDVDRDRRTAQVMICHAAPDADAVAPLLELSIEREDHTGPQQRHFKLKVAVRIKRGAPPLVIGRFESGGAPSELIASLR